MKRYRSFAECPAEPSEFACNAFRVAPSEQQRQGLLAGYHRLPTFPDVTASLKRTQIARFRLYAFLNRLASDVESVLDHAGVRKYFLDIVSIDEFGSIKPDSEVYHHFLQGAGSSAKKSWLIS